MNNSKDVLYRFDNLKLSYGDQFTLNVPELEIKRGITLGLSGPNGSGKSTLMRILAFLERPTSGSFIFNGTKYDRNSVVENRRVTYLFQDPYLLKRSVFENVAYGLKVRGKRNNLADRVNEVLSWVGLDHKKFGSRRWYQLSGGEAKRVAIASRLVLAPEVLILDEPVANIDHVSVMLIKDAIKKLCDKYNSTLIISSHDLLWLNSNCDNIIRLHDGCIAGSGTDNIIPGPWSADIDGLWSKTLTGGEKIFSIKPPSSKSIAILNPVKIIISTQKQASISAQNMLKGEISYLTVSGELNTVKVIVNVSDLSFTCNVTVHAVNELQLVPGKKVWLIFKASSFLWQ